MGVHSWKERLRYRIDRFFQSGFTLQLVIASLLIVAVILVFVIGAEIFRLDPGEDFGKNEGPFWPSSRLWWVINHTLETYWLETTLAGQIASVILTLFNLLVFAAIVGLVGSKIQERLENMRRGTSRAIEDGHYVIIGWSEKVLPVVQELHAGWERGTLVVAVLSERPIEDVHRELRRGMRGKKRVRLVVRQGSPADMNDLQLVSVSTARAAIVFRMPNAPGDSDARVVKTLMAIRHLINQEGDTGPVPFVIAEIEKTETVPLARAAAHGLPMSLVQPVDALGKIILQTARQPGLAAVYNEILGHERNEVHTAPASDYPHLIGRPWREVVFAFPAAIPLGILRARAVRLVPHASVPDISLQGEDVIYFLALDSESLYSAPVSIPETVESVLPDLAAMNGGIISNLLVVGFNEKALPLIREYNAYAGSAGQRFALTLVSPFDAARDTLQNILFHSLDIAVLTDDYLVPGMLDRIDAGEFDAIIVLSETAEGGSWEEADTRVIMTLLLLRSLRWKAELDEKASTAFNHIVGEILHMYNKDLAESTHTIRDVIISETLISKMIAQICRDPHVEGAIRDFFDERGAEIYLKPITLYAVPGSRVAFADILAASLQRGETAIGVAPGGESSRYTPITLNPPRNEMFDIHEQMRLIVIAESEG